jgi:chromate transporter
VKLLFLYFTFARIGLFAIGGGLATLPFLFDLADSSPAWLTREAVGNMLAVAQSLPGAIGVNLASYTGFLNAGIPGSFAAALALISPSIIIIIIIARTLKAFKESRIAKTLFAGFRPAAAGLLSAAGFGAIKVSLYNDAAPIWYNAVRREEAALFIIIFVLIYKFKKHPVIYIAAAGIAGIVLGL